MSPRKKSAPRVPFVFRIHSPELREKIDAFTVAEEARTGYALTATTVAEKLLGEAFDRRAREAEALKEALEVLNLSDPDGRRLATIRAPEDAAVAVLCEAHGYGAVMDAAARLWRAKDPLGAHTMGACVATVQQTVRLVRDALGSAK